MCLDAVCFKKQQQRRADYGFHAYMELCQLVYCLLSRSRRVSSLRNVNAWEEYMDVSKLSQYYEMPTAEFLQNYDFGAMLREFNGSEVLTFKIVVAMLSIVLWNWSWHNRQCCLDL